MGSWFRLENEYGNMYQAMGAVGDTIYPKMFAAEKRFAHFGHRPVPQKFSCADFFGSMNFSAQEFFGRAPKTPWALGVLSPLGLYNGTAKCEALC